jgi:hypothetical protein
MTDRWDIVGGLGVALIGAGVWGLAGQWWAVIFWGACLLALYVLHEMPKGRRG